MATATKKTESKSKDKATAAPEATEKATDAPKAKRTAARITLTQTKLIEDQFDTQSKRIKALDAKLVEVIKGYEDKPEHMVPTKAQAAREELAKAAEAVVAAKESFAEIGEAMRDFFA